MIIRTTIMLCMRDELPLILMDATVLKSKRYFGIMLFQISPNQIPKRSEIYDLVLFWSSNQMQGKQWEGRGGGS
jgi:hypothetical protein